MEQPKLSRRHFLALCGAAAASSLLGGARARQGTEALRIGAVLPTLTGPQPLGAFTEDVVGNLADMGALLAMEDLPAQMSGGGKGLEVLITTGPEANSAIRAAERLSGVEEVYGIVGGFSLAEALALSRLAAQRKFLFFNIGVQSDALRSEACNPYTFHIEASTSMYLDALADWTTRAGIHRWFFVTADDKEHQAQYAQAVRALQARQVTSENIGRAVVAPDQPLYTGTFDTIHQAVPDLVVLLLEPYAQLVFQGQYETSGLKVPIVGYPAPAAQTRQFYASSLYNAPETGSTQHLALWEATLDAAAAELNTRFLGRFGQAMDPPAWAAYTGIKILAEAALAAGSTDSRELIRYLESAEASFDVGKGAGISFRPWNHQLRQPLYRVRTQANYQDKKSLQDLAALEGELPTKGDTGLSPAERLDKLGESEGDSGCRLEASGDRSGRWSIL